MAKAPRSARRDPRLRAPLRIPNRDAIRHLLIDHKLDITGLAEEIGYGRQYVSKVINGNYNSIVAQEKIAARLGVKLDAIFPAVEPVNTHKAA